MDFKQKYLKYKKKYLVLKKMIGRGTNKNKMSSNEFTYQKNSIKLESMEFPDPVIEVTIKLKNKNEKEKIVNGLTILSHEDPSFTFVVKSDLIILKGMGNLHIDIMIDRLKREYNININKLNISWAISYKEKIVKSAEYEYKYKKKDKEIILKLLIEPSVSSKIRIINIIKDNTIPKEIIIAVEKGIKNLSNKGIIAGYPIIGCKVTIINIKYKNNPNISDFELASEECFKKANIKANISLMEPIMKIEVSTPEEYMDNIINDVSQKRGKIISLDEKDNGKILSFYAPLAAIFEYTLGLRTISSGTAELISVFSHYEKVPSYILENITSNFKECYKYTTKVGEWCSFESK